MKKELNEYLFLEFGLDTEGEDISRVSNDWPFQLEQLDEIELPDGDTTYVFRFESDGELLYAIAGRSMTFFSSSGIDLPNLRRQILGSAWIADRSPIDLNTSRGEHLVIPRVPDRRKRIESLTRDLDPTRPFTILEGLFLESAREHLALVRFDGDDDAHVVVDKIRMKNIPFQEASPWRRLAIGIGTLIERGQLG
jgi:hypothetical protein